MDRIENSSNGVVSVSYDKSVLNVIPSIKS